MRTFYLIFMLALLGLLPSVIAAGTPSTNPYYTIPPRIGEGAGFHNRADQVSYNSIGDVYTYGFNYLNNGTSCAYAEGSAITPLVDSRGYIWMLPSASNVINIFDNTCAKVGTIALTSSWMTEAVLADITGDSDEEYCTILASRNLTCYSFNGSTITKLMDKNVTTSGNLIFNLDNLQEACGGSYDCLGIINTPNTKTDYMSLTTYLYDNDTIWKKNLTAMNCNGVSCDVIQTQCEGNAAGTYASSGDRMSTQYLDYNKDGSKEIIVMFLRGETGCGGVCADLVYHQTGYFQNLASTYTNLYTLDTGFTSSVGLCGSVPGSRMIGKPAVITTGSATSTMQFYFPPLNRLYTSAGAIVVTYGNKNLVAGDMGGATFKACTVNNANLSCYNSAGTLTSSCNLPLGSAVNHTHAQYYPYIDRKGNWAAIATPQGVYNTSCDLQMPLSSGNTSTINFVTVADVDGDDLQDIIVANSTAMYIYFTSPVATTSTDPTPTLLITGATDNKVDAQLIATDAENDTLVYYFECEGGLSPKKPAENEWKSQNDVICSYIKGGTYLIRGYVREATSDYSTFNPVSGINYLQKYVSVSGTSIALDACNAIESFTYTDDFRNHGWTFRSGSPLYPSVPFGYNFYGWETQPQYMLSWDANHSDPAWKMTCYNSLLNISWIMSISNMSTRNFFTSINYLGQAIASTPSGTYSSIPNDTFIQYSMIVDIENQRSMMYVNGTNTSGWTALTNNNPSLPVMSADKLSFNAFNNAGLRVFIIETRIESLGSSWLVVYNTTTNTTGILITTIPQNCTWAGFKYTCNDVGQTHGYNSTMYEWSECQEAGYNTSLCPVWMVRDRLLGDAGGWVLGNIIYIVVILTLLIIFMPMIIVAMRNKKGG